MDLSGALIYVVVGAFLAAVFAVASILAARSRRQAEAWDEVVASPEPSERTVGTAVATPRLQPKRSTRKSSRRPSFRWTGPGESFKVAGREIEAPWVWLGTGLLAAGAQHETEAALVNPRLPVDFSRPDHDGAHLGYWPRYDAIDPRSRAAYLLWLQAGRSDPDANIGYVFLYFYGIERRLLVELLPEDRDQPEIAALIAEIERLRGIYGSNGSFDGYSRRLLDFVQIGRHLDGSSTPAPPLHSTNWELPLGLRVALGRQLADGQPVSAEWALAWGLHHHSVGKRTPVTRCRNEIIELFKVRFAQRYPEGLKVKPPKRRLKVEYRPASSSLRHGTFAAHLDLPDVDALSAPLSKVHAVLDQCCDDLASYSRWVGRNPDLVGTLNAAALLPPALIAGMDTTALTDLRAWLSSAAQAGGIARTGELLQRWKPTTAGKWTKKDSVRLCQLLEGLGAGVEPDVRFGGARLDKAQTLVLFELGDGAPGAASPEYMSATLMLHLASAVVHADGVVDAQEEEDLERLLERNLDLSETERTRLRAHLRWLILDHPGMGGMNARLKALGDADRAALARAMARIATAGSGAGPSELKLLTKIYTMLGQDPSGLYEHVHHAQARADEGPVTVRPGTPKPSGLSIPAQPAEQTPAAGSSEFELNLDRVAARIAESEKVASMLGDIFADDDTNHHAPPKSTDAPGHAVAGLDSAHSSLVRLLVTRPTWPHEVAAAEAEALGLILGGALETINDAAFDCCDAPLIEGDEELEVLPDVAAELCP